jgi:hypothetical protein
VGQQTLLNGAKEHPTTSKICWILMIFKLKFGGGNLFSPAMTNTIEGNNSVGSLLEPLLKKVTPVVG